MVWKMGKTVLVTGATGRIGSQLCRELWKRGYAVRAFVLPDDPFVQRFQEVPCDIVRGSVLDQNAIEKAVKDCEIVVHLAACMVPPKEMDENTYMDINVKGTWFVVRCALRAGVKRLVYGGSDAVYPPFRHSTNPIFEDEPQQPHFLYSLTKTLNESIVFEAWRESNYKMEATVTRFGSVMAQDEILSCFSADRVKSVLRSHALCPATTLFDPDNTRPWEKFEKLKIPDEALCIPYGPDDRSWRMHFTHVLDAVQGIMLALESSNASGEVFNILGPEATSRASAVKYLAGKTGQRYYEAHLDTMWEFECSIEKARRMLGYDPQFDTKRLIDDALAWRGKGVFTVHKLNSAEF
jgi:nucleoside-diphosphate-sugar epimerase